MPTKQKMTSTRHLVKLLMQSQYERKYMAFQIFTYLAVCAVLISGAACTHVLYGPADLQISPLAENNDHRVGGQYQVIGESRGVGLQGVYALKKHVSLKGQANILSGKGDINYYTGSFPNPTYATKAFAAYAEAAVGYHRQMTGRIWGAVFAGGGINRLRYLYNGASKTSINYSRGFVQPELVFTGKYADLGLGMRSSYINYFYGSIHAKAPVADLSQFYLVEKKRNYFVQEASIMVGGHLGRFYLRNSMTYLLKPFGGVESARLQFGTSLLYQLQSKK